MQSQCRGPVRCTNSHGRNNQCCRDAAPAHRRCDQCLAKDRRYRHSAAGRAARRRYNRSAKGRLAQAVYDLRVGQGPRGGSRPRVDRDRELRAVTNELEALRGKED